MRIPRRRDGEALDRVVGAPRRRVEDAEVVEHDETIRVVTAGPFEARDGLVRVARPHVRRTLEKRDRGTEGVERAPRRRGTAGQTHRVVPPARLERRAGPHGGSLLGDRHGRPGKATGRGDDPDARDAPDDTGRRTGRAGGWHVAASVETDRDRCGAVAPVRRTSSRVEGITDSPRRDLPPQDRGRREEHGERRLMADPLERKIEARGDEVGHERHEQEHGESRIARSHRDSQNGDDRREGGREDADEGRQAQHPLLRPHLQEVVVRPGPVIGVQPRQIGTGRRVILLDADREVAGTDSDERVIGDQVRGEPPDHRPASVARSAVRIRDADAAQPRHDRMIGTRE